MRVVKGNLQLATLFPGNIVGEMSFLGQFITSAGVAAVEPVELYKLEVCRVLMFRSASSLIDLFVAFLPQWDHALTCRWIFCTTYSRKIPQSAASSSSPSRMTLPCAWRSVPHVWKKVSMRVLDVWCRMNLHKCRRTAGNAESCGECNETKRIATFHSTTYGSGPASFDAAFPLSFRRLNISDALFTTGVVRRGERVQNCIIQLPGQVPTLERAIGKEESQCFREALLGEHKRFWLGDILLLKITILILFS